MKKNIVLFLFLTFNFAHGQSVNIWFRTTFSYSFKNNISVDAEFQHRRQQGFEGNHPLHKNLVFSIRSWMHYSFDNNGKLHLSPLAYYKLYAPIQKIEDESVPAQKELRSSLGYSYQHKFTDKFSVNGRAMLEYRIFLQNNNWFRQRSRIGAKYQINDVYGLVFQEEILFNLNELFKKNFYDQNRITLGVQKKTNKQNYELGYMYVYRLPQRSSDQFSDHNFYINLTFHL